MGGLRSLTMAIQFLLLYSLFSSMVTNCLPLVHPTQCHEDESNALLQFREIFIINKSASYEPLSYPKTTSWMPSTDCCSWDGIECDELTGHVIGIDLSSSQLYGSIVANSSLFHLVHLQRLDLADNHFNQSQIPSSIGELSKLRHLNLSQTTLSGEIPPQVSQLSNLLSLDLSCYNESSPPDAVNLLQLKVSTLRSLIQNSTRFEIFRLNYVTISSSIPHILTNITSLQELSLIHCDLYGEFPIEIFHLPNLKALEMAFNPNLMGMLPNFPSSALISKLNLRETGFYGTIPASIGNLTNLAWLNLRGCNLHGEIPQSLFRLENLAILSLSFNSLQGQLVPDMFMRLKMLTVLDLSHNKLSLLTRKSSSNITLPRIQRLSLRSCNLTGKIPSWIMNLTTLTFLGLQENKLHGEIPHSLFRLENLTILTLTSNLLEGQLDIDKFLKFKMLTLLGLGDNVLSLFVGKSSSNITLPPLQFLDLNRCNLGEFPNFVQHLDELEGLLIEDNGIKSIPNWMWSKRSLMALSASQNSLAGEIPPTICNLKSLVSLDLSHNNLSGTIPSCLGSFSQSLQILMLQGNKFFGRIPQTYVKGSALTLIDFSNNNLQGQLPRELVNCKTLEYLDVSHNRINDSFPFWLGELPDLKVIGLRSNEFYGDIKCPRRCTFPKLHIIDLSHNEFSGKLSSEIIQNLKSMRVSNLSQLQYQDSTVHYRGKNWFTNIHYSFAMSNKGVTLSYTLQNFYYLIAIDLSSNRISGEIPDVVGELKSLVSLNLSNNRFIGNIPSSLGKLSNLESLDLSLNNLSGKIPQQLTELTFLEFFNVSFNKLSGPIPESNQLSTFQANSFEGNQGLCGIQLSKKCGDHAGSPPSTSDDDQDSGSSFEFDWKIVLIGYAGGLVVGLALGSTLSLSNLLGRVKRMF